MNDFCQCGADGLCVRCGAKGWPGIPLLCVGGADHHAPAAAVRCAHLGGARPAITAPCGCGANRVEVEAAKCDRHGRCLPYWSPPDIEKWQAQPESAVYRPCAICPDFAAITPRPAV